MAATRIYVPRETAAISVGANEVALEIERHARKGRWAIHPDHPERLLGGVLARAPGGGGGRGHSNRLRKRHTWRCGRPVRIGLPEGGRTPEADWARPRRSLTSPTRTVGAFSAAEPSIPCRLRTSGTTRVSPASRRHWPKAPSLSWKPS